LFEIKFSSDSVDFTGDEITGSVVLLGDERPSAEFSEDESASDNFTEDDSAAAISVSPDVDFIGDKSSADFMRDEGTSFVSANYL